MSADDFLSRWSRRKREARRAEAPPPREAEAPPEPPEGADEPGREPLRDLRGGADEGEEGPTLTAEEIAALPRVEDLTAESDIRVFLRKGVPELLRKAALRRVWSVDPAIRDYVSEARDYAYDWNVPGGVPGNGPILPTGGAPNVLPGGLGGEGPGPGEHLAAQAATDPVRTSAPRAPRAFAPGSAPSRELSQGEGEPSGGLASSAGPPASLPSSGDGSAIPPHRAGDAAMPSPASEAQDEDKPETILPSSNLPRRHGKAKPV